MREMFDSVAIVAIFAALLALPGCTYAMLEDTRPLCASPEERARYDILSTAMTIGGLRYKAPCR